MGFSRPSQHQDTATLLIVLFSALLLAQENHSQLMSQRRSWGELGSDQRLLTRGPGESELLTARGRGQDPIAGPLIPLPAQVQA